MEPPPITAEPRSVVLRVQHDPTLRQTRLIACELASKQWFQTAAQPWPVHREQLRRFGVREQTLALTDAALSTGSRDAQFPALPISLPVLHQAGFQPLIW